MEIDRRSGNAEHPSLSKIITGIVIYWTICILPVPVVERSKLPRRQNWVLWRFSVWVGLCVVSSWRLRLVRKAAQEGRITSGFHAFNVLQCMLT